MSPQTILPNMNEIRPVVSEELSSQDIDDGRTMLEHVQSPITPTIFVKSKWHLRMHICMSPQTILPNMNEIRRVVSEELRSQDIDDGRTDGRTTQSKTLYPSQLRCVGYNNNNLRLLVIPTLI